MFDRVEVLHVNWRELKSGYCEVALRLAFGQKRNADDSGFVLAFDGLHKLYKKHVLITYKNMFQMK